MATEPTSSLELSDEDWLKNSATIFNAIPVEEEELNKDDQNQDQGNKDEGEQKPNPDDDDQGNKDDDQPNQGNEDDQGEAAGKSRVDEGEGNKDEPNKDEPAGKDKPRDESGKFTKQEPNKDQPNGEKKPENKPVDNKSVDYEANHKALFAPIKANGKDFQVQDVDEARRLISMGLNYNKKMSTLKPHLAIVKQLENASLLDADKLNYLIDLSNGNPQAIAKLIADHKIDPLDIKSDDAAQYKPGNHRVSETEVDLDNVVDDLRDHPKFTQVMQLVGKEWDKASQGIIAADPGILRNLAHQMDNGMYERIDSILQRKKMFGGNSGKSDLELYREIGTELAQAGEFDDIINPKGKDSQQAPSAPAGQVVDPSGKDASREQQRRAAAPSKVGKPAPAKPKLPENLLDLSDEDFMKLKL